MNIFRFLDSIEAALRNSPGLFFTRLSVIDKNKFLSLIDSFRSTLPEEFKKAQWISRESQRILQEARTKGEKVINDSNLLAEELIKETQQECQKLVTENEITIRARESAREISQDAKSRAESIIAKAESKASDLIANAERYSAALKKQTEEEANLTKISADEYLKKVFARLEKDTLQILNIISSSQKSIQGADSAEIQESQNN